MSRNLNYDYKKKEMKFREKNVYIIKEHLIQNKHNKHIS